MKKILFIPAQYLPIPAVKGGAVEVLLTQLIEQNEIHHKADFYVISKDNKEAKKYSYQHTNIKYLKRSFFSRICFIFVFCFRKLVYNRLTKCLVKHKQFAFNELTYFGYRCNRFAKKVQPDIVVSESYDKIHRLWPIVKWFGNENFYYHLHYTKEEKLEVRKMFPNTIAISEFVLNHWVKDKSIKGKNTVLYNGIDLDSFNIIINEHDKTGIKNKYKIDDNDFVVLFVGRLRPHKGILQLLKSFNKVKHEHIKLLLVGDFLSESKEHGGNEQDFEIECLSLIQQNKNIIRTGDISYDQINQLYQISDIQIIPSMWEEGAGLVAIEGMACGLPLIITNSGGMPEYTGKECAIILERDNQLIDNIATSIIKLFEDKDLRNKMSLASIERSKQFSKEQYYQKYMNILLSEDKNYGK